MKKHEYEDIDFKTNKGAKIKLIFEKVEYRAYIWKHGGWQEMKLGATRPNALIDYIKKNY